MECMLSNSFKLVGLDQHQEIGNNSSILIFLVPNWRYTILPLPNSCDEDYGSFIEYDVIKVIRASF